MTRPPQRGEPDRIEASLGARVAKGLDRFDRVQLADVLAVCAASRSLSEAGRALFAESRKGSTTNDADRLGNTSPASASRSSSSARYRCDEGRAYLGGVTPARILATLDAMDPLGELPRTGWLLRGIQPAESIAAHTQQVTLLVALLVDACRAAGMTVDGERALRMALVHDAPEARLGDVPMPIKTPELEAALYVVEASLAADMLPSGLLSDWTTFEAGVCLEARLVKAADKLQMLHKLWAYEQAGHRHPLMETMWRNRANLRSLDVPPVAALYRAIFARAGRELPEAPP